MTLRIEKAQRATAPWSHAWGLLNLNNLTAGTFYADCPESPAIGTSLAAIGRIPFPEEGGTLRNLSARFRSGSLAVDCTFTVYILGVPTGMLVTIPAGQGGASLKTELPVPAVAGGNVINLEFTCPAPPGTASVRPIVFLNGEVYL